jgi:hypothetical protein
MNEERRARVLFSIDPERSKLGALRLAGGEVDR